MMDDDIALIQAHMIGALAQVFKDIYQDPNKSWDRKATMILDKGGFISAAQAVAPIKFRDRKSLPPKERIDRFANPWFDQALELMESVLSSVGKD